MTMNYVPVEPRKRLHVGDRVSFFDTSDSARGYAVIVRFDDCDEADLVANFSVHIRCADENEDRFISRFNGDQLCVLSPVVPESKREAAEQHAAAGIGPTTGKELAGLLGVPANPNPKKAFGETKPDLSLVPAVGTLHQAMAHEDGGKKYGPYNWRKDPVEVMTYIAAARRHLDLFLDGQDYTSDTNVHNLGAVMACCAIVLDSQELGILIDNRPLPGPSDAVQNRLRAQKIAAAKKT